MLDDIRNHEPRPTREESDWIATDPVGVLVSFFMLAVLALGITLATSDRGEARPEPAATTANAQESRS